MRSPFSLSIIKKRVRGREGERVVRRGGGEEERGKVRGREGEEVRR